MKIYKGRGEISGFRVELQEELDYPFSHFGEHTIARDHFIPPHKHPTWEMVLQMSGQSSWGFNGRRIHLKEWELLLCPPGLQHEKSQKEDSDYRISFFGCRMDPEIWPSLKSHVSLERMEKLSDARDLLRYIRILEEEVLSNQPLQKKAIELVWKQIWLTVYRLATSPRRAWNKKETWLAHRVRTLVEAQPGERWTLPSIARLVGFAPNYFSELFRRETGQSFHRYLTEARVEFAKTALLQGEESLTDIALRLGFSSSQHFSRIFTQHTNANPSRWAKQSRNSPPKRSVNPLCQV